MYIYERNYETHSFGQLTTEWGSVHLAFSSRRERMYDFRDEDSHPILPAYFLVQTPEDEKK